MTKNPQNIILVGMMGAGKTTVGRLLAAQLGSRFIDTDQEIEARTGVSIPTIFEIEGEAGFRNREAKVVDDLTREAGLVMATGGGVVLDPRNRKNLAERGFVVYLHALPRLLFQRTRHDRNRPLLQVDDPLAKLGELYTLRDPLYREVADLIVESGEAGAQRLVRQLEQEFRKRCAH